MDSLIDHAIPTRLVVIMTDCLANNHELARAVHWMAERENLSILYLVLLEDSDNLLEISRHMATMKAVTSANRLLVEVKTAEKNCWLETLRKATSPSDVIICQEEQTVINGRFKTIPLSRFLSQQLNSPICTLSGYYHPFQPQVKKWIHEIFALLGFLIILVVFTWLQISLDQALEGGEAKFQIFVALCAEISAIWAWYKFVYR